MKPLRTVLNIAEKASVAKEITKHLSKGAVRTRVSMSKFNPVYEFAFVLNQENVCMRVTSVSGHIMRMEFEGRFKSWKLTTPGELFSAPIEKVVIEDKKDTVANVQSCAKDSDTLALWLDCDREGENIAFEVVDLVKRIQPDVTVLRAKFSALTKEDIETAVANMVQPDLNLSLAVDARQEIDLRLGAVFTRLQTEELSKRIRILGGRLISYGPCQFPTMGFVAKRFLEIYEFVQKDFWTLELEVVKDGVKTVLESDVGRCFDKQKASELLAQCQSSGQVTITKVDKKRKIKQRPKPLATVPFQKLVSSKLKMNSDTAMKLAEKLYSEGYISYPRTETDKFPATINLREFVARQGQKSTAWQQYALKLAKTGKVKTRDGDNDDKSHPPIYPVKAADESTFADPREWKVYELVARHFLAACGEDALGQECTVEAEVNGICFSTKGLSIEAPNYLEVYPYQQWSESQLPLFAAGEVLSSPNFLVEGHKTQPPNLLSEADLISHMDSSGIGTDATIHLHIKTVQTRGYVSVNEKNQFQPTHLGLALYQGHKEIGYQIVEPELRASMEKGMSDIAKGKQGKDEMVKDCLGVMKGVFDGTVGKLDVLERAVRHRLLEDKTSPYAGASVVCFKCKQPGHLANQCPGVGGTTQTVHKTGEKRVVKKTEKPEVTKVQKVEEKKVEEKKKTCEHCGVVGRHPRNSTCPLVKKTKKGVPSTNSSS